MAQAFQATIYGTAGTFDALQGGWQVNGPYSGPSYQSFPVEGTTVIGVSPAITLTPKGMSSSVTINSIIEVLPTGLTIPSFVKRYVCDATEATLNTARNA